MCIEVADAEDDSLVESATSQKYFKRSTYLGLRGPPGCGRPPKKGRWPWRTLTQGSGALGAGIWGIFI